MKKTETKFQVVPLAELPKNIVPIESANPKAANPKGPAHREDRKAAAAQITGAPPSKGGQ